LNAPGLTVKERTLRGGQKEWTVTHEASGLPVRAKTGFDRKWYAEEWATILAPLADFTQNAAHIALQDGRQGEIVRRRVNASYWEFYKSLGLWHNITKQEYRQLHGELLSERTN